MKVNWVCAPLVTNSAIAWKLTFGLRSVLQALAPGLTPRAVNEALTPIQMRRRGVSQTDGRPPVMPRYTEPAPWQELLLHQLQLT